MATAMAEPRSTEAHATKKRPYVYVFGALAAVTALELNVGILGLAHDLQVAALLMMATLKASLVAAYYMHLRYEPRWLILIPFGGLALVTVLVVALMGAGL
ncbi:MAG: hypothetical protein A3K59_06810 [Euryarchaeota archaeon RBG_19FT_COMBO_69_17]|nr:MAG: hypothetical protein A3K59_06810 [Euryarchaeota archaeon RBG_19FT_COMBO_69_17]